ncbi:hypothetical protein [Ferrovum sp.]|uniref:hypothetical protein n=1 Tax=Ferrovum sp. TaxID=2609467 RepID=UPI0026049B58|nr:hypothetical protein [Ferrovum sp.]
MRSKSTGMAIFALLFSGCSSVSVHDPLVMNQNDTALVYYCVESTAQMSILNKALSKEANKKKFEEDQKESLVGIDDYLNMNITKSPGLVIKKLPSCKALKTLPGNPNALSLSITLSGYGSLNERWKKIFFGTVLVEGIAQGVIVSSATHNLWLGIVVTVGELGREYLTWSGLAVAMAGYGQEYLAWSGMDWLVGKTYAPVTLEGELVALKDQKTLWKDSSFVTDNSDELKNMSENERESKDVQLRASLHKAEKELISSLNTYLTKEILKNRPTQSTVQQPMPGK